MRLAAGLKACGLGGVAEHFDLGEETTKQGGGGVHGFILQGLQPAAKDTPPLPKTGLE